MFRADDPGPRPAYQSDFNLLRRVFLQHQAVVPDSEHHRTVKHPLNLRWVVRE